MNKVLYMSYDGMTDPLGQSQVIPYLEGLVKKGFKITLLSCEKKDPYEKYKLQIAQQLQHAGINWKVVAYSKQPPVISTLYDLFKMRRRAYELHRKEHFQIIHCRSYITAFVGLWMKRRFGTRFLFDMRGFWADERVEGGIWNLKNPLYKVIYSFFKRSEKQFLSEADHVVSLTYKGKDIIHSWKEISGQPIPISVIPCCVDTNHFDPKKVSAEERDKIKKKLGIVPGDKVLTYLGSLGTWYMTDEMLIFFKELIKEHPGYKFLFITKDDIVKVKKAANRLEIPLEKLIFTSSERKELPTLLSVSEVAVSFILPSFSKSASSPTKLGELFSMGIPVICNKGVGDVDSLLQDEFSSLLYNMPGKFNFSDLKISDTEKQKLRNISNSTFSLDKGIKQYQVVYTKLVDNGNGF